MYKKVIKKVRYFLRKLTALNRMEPSFIIIGEARCGTTSLFNYISQNSKVISPIKKEIHFFDYNFNESKLWYKSFFPRKRKNKITGEATPYYFSHPKAAKRIKELYPSIKIILILRNPVDRAISSYFKQRSLKLEPAKTLEEAIGLEKERLNNSINNILHKKDYDFNHKNFAYVTRGLYYDNLKRWQKLFNKDQILIFEFEDLYTNIDYNYKKVISFLKLDPQNIKFEHFNKGAYKKTEKNYRKELTKKFEESNKKLYKELNSYYNWK